MQKALLPFVFCCCSPIWSDSALPGQSVCVTTSADPMSPANAVLKVQCLRIHVQLSMLQVACQGVAENLTLCRLHGLELCQRASMLPMRLGTVIASSCTWQAAATSALRTPVARRAFAA